MSVMTAVSAFTHRAARRSARLSLLGYSALLAGALVLLASWIVAHAEEPPGGLCTWDYCKQVTPLSWSVLELSDLGAVAVLALGLLVIVPALVAAAVAAERRAGTLDQLRTTPLSPFALVAGLVAGAPARIYLLLVGPLALHVFCGLTGVIPLSTMISTTAVLATGGLASAVIGLSVALAPRQETGGALVALGVAAALGGAALLGAGFAGQHEFAGWAFMHPGGAIEAALIGQDGLARRLVASPWRLDQFDRADFVAALALSPLLSCLASLATVALLGAACCRKLAAPQAPLLGKPQAILLFTGVAAGAIVPAHALVPRPIGQCAVGGLALLFTALLMPFGALLGLFATPTFESWAIALRRRSRVRWWSDDAAPHGAVWAMAAVLVALVVATFGVGDSLSDVCSYGARVPFVLGWVALTVASLPVFVMFGATRYATAAARWAFGVATMVHLFAQAIAIGVAIDAAHPRDHLFVQIAVVLAVAVPAWVAFRQRVLRCSTIAA